MSTAELTEELRLVEEDLARLRATAADLRRRIGERDEEPTDAAERSALIEAAEEQEALIDQLEAWREELLRRLGSHAQLTGADREVIVYADFNRRAPAPAPGDRRQSPPGGADGADDIAGATQFALPASGCPRRSRP
jgi:hypothetical protein